MYDEPQDPQDEWTTLTSQAPTQQMGDDEWTTITPPPQQQQFPSIQTNAQRDYLPQSRQQAGPGPVQNLRTEPEQPSWYENAWNTAAAAIPQPVKNAWDWANTGLTDLPTRIMNPIGEAEAKWGESGTGVLHNLALYGGLADKRLGEVISSMTSPVGLASFGGSAASSLARYAPEIAESLPVVSGALPKVGSALSTTGRVGGGMMAAEGAKTVADPYTSLLDKTMGGVNMLFGGMMARAPHAAGELPTKAAEPRSTPSGPKVQEPLPVKQAAAPIEHVFDPRQQPVLPEQPLVQPEIQTTGRTPARPPSSEQFTPDVQRERMMELTKAGMPDTVEGVNAAIQQAKEFDPSTLKDLKRTPQPTESTAPQELEFLNPNTGETRLASEAQPGDIPLSPEAPLMSTGRRAGKRMGAPNLGLPTPRVEAPLTPPKGASFGDWLKNLGESESGEFDVDAFRRGQREQEVAREEDFRRMQENPQEWLRQQGERGELQTDFGRAALAANRQTLIEAGHHPDSVAGMTPREVREALAEEYGGQGRFVTPEGAEALQPRRVDPNTVARENRTFIDNLDSTNLRSFIQRQSTNPNYNEPGLEGHNMLQYARDVEDGRIAGEGQPSTRETLRSYGRMRESEPAPQWRDLEYENEPYQAEPGTHIAEGWVVDNATGEILRNAPGEQSIADRYGREPDVNRFEEWDRQWKREQQFGEKRKSLEEVEAGKRTPAMERLGKLIGESRAKELASGQEEIKFAEKPARRGKAKKLDPNTIKSWSEWGDRTIAQEDVDPSKPGISTEPHHLSSMFPKAFGLVYRDAEGVPIAKVKSGLDGTTISDFAVRSDLGLRRGKVAFEMLKEAYDRGAREPSDITSDLTKNLIDRVKRLISKAASGEEGYLDVDVIANHINKLIDSFSGIKRKVSEFMKSESGEGDPEAGLARLKQLFQKSRTEPLTPEELQEAATLKRGQQQAPAKAQPEVPERTAGAAEPMPVKDNMARFNALPENAKIAVNDMVEQGHSIESALAAAESTRARMQPKQVSEYLGGRPEVSTGPVRPENVRPPTEPAAQAPSEPAKLPRDLAGARPRFNIGNKSYEPQFKDDLDKALYIIAQDKKSPADARYLKFVMEQTGLDEAGARKVGRDIRDVLKRGLTGMEPGEIPLNSISRNHPDIVNASSRGPAPQPTAIPQAGQPTARAAPATPKARATTGLAGPQPSPKKLLNANELDPNVEVQARKAPKPLPEEGTAAKIWNLPRAMQSVDLPGLTSAALRQARPLAFTPKWFKAWGSAVKSFGDEAALEQINAKIKQSKYFQPRYEQVLNKAGEVVKYVERQSIAEEYGLKMTDIINHREEAIVSNLAEKIPGYGRYVKASNRAYTGFLNDLRAAKFEQMMDGAAAAGRGSDVVLGKKIADFVNNATGRGSLSFAGGAINLEPVARELSFALYSPRALSARLAFMNPYNYTMQDPLVRKEYLKSLASIVVSWGAMNTLASFVPKVHVSFDPNSTDFMKPRFGKTRLDTGSGFQQLLVLTNRELPQVLGGGGTSAISDFAGRPGKFTPLGATPMSPTRWTLPGKYLANQMNPTLAYAATILNATNKKPVDLTDATLQLAAPMFVTDVFEAASENQNVAAVFAPIVSSIGMGQQTFEKGSFGKPKITPVLKHKFGINLPTTMIGKTHRR